VLVVLECYGQKTNLIIISKDNKHHIEKWLGSIDSTLLFKEFYTLPKDSMPYYLHKANGIIISGGEDVNPSLYNKPGYAELCVNIDYYRDSIEIMLIQFAIENKVPILGICRGNQIMNVVYGGTLIPDIPSFTHSTTNHNVKNDSAHLIIAEPNSWLKNRLSVDKAWVNSRHHQAIAQIASIFQVSAFSSDGIIESIEIKQDQNHPFAVGVQWHPESLKNELSYSIGKLFIDQNKK